MSEDLKKKFISNLLARMAEFANLQSTLYAMSETYTDRGYQSGGDAEITDEDCLEYGQTAADIKLGIELAEQLGNFVDNATIARGNYRVTANKLRNDI